jgi:hypothetical protein
MEVTTVTNENFNEYVDKQLGVPEAPPPEVVEDPPPPDPAEEFVGKEEDKEEGEEKKPSKKEKLNARFKELTDARKEAEAKAAEKEAEAKAIREEKAALERERNELKAKYEPPKTDELGAKPELAQFNTAADYEKAMEDWTQDKVRIERTAAEKQEREAKRAAEVKKAWDENLKAAKAQFDDYVEVIQASEVMLSEEAKEAIFESELGPKMLYHFAKNPEEAKKLTELTVDKMLKAIGRLEAKLGDKPQTPPDVKVADLSKAPAPISPLKGGTAAVGTLNGYDEVPKNMSYDDWKKRRLAGKIH